MRAFSDYVSLTSFITEAKAKVRMLPFERTNTNRCSRSCIHAENLLMIAMKINDVAETNLQVFSNFTNSIPTKPIHVSQMRYVSLLQLADPTFDVPSKTDILPGADVLEEVLLNIRVKDNGVVMHELFFGWIVFWPVGKLESVNDFPILVILANTSLIASSSCMEDLIAEFEN